MTLSLSPQPSAVLPVGSGLSAILRRMGNGVLGAVRAMQHARMNEAMARLSDDQLAQVGLTRADIPRHAHDCIYGPSK